MNWTDRWAPPAAKKSPTELRKFGLVMAGAFGVIGAIAMWRGRAWGTYAVALAAVFLVLGLVAPRVLRPIEHGWMAVAERMGRVMTALILTIVFYVIITPIGLLRRLFGGDSMGKRPAPAMASYWVPIEPDGPASRPDKPY